MGIKTEEYQAIHPPRLIPALAEGFNAVTNRIILILFPIGLDLLLWFGPHLKVRELFTPVMDNYFQLMAQWSTADSTPIIANLRNLWDLVLEEYNLFSVLRTYPIGITSLLGPMGLLHTPLGISSYYEVPSLAAFLGFWLFFVLSGLFLGSLYFGLVARNVHKLPRPFNVQEMFWQFAQVILLTISVIIIMMLLAIPILLMIIFIQLISPGLVQISLILLGLLAMWLMLPLIFSAHGIFLYRQNAMVSMLTSARLVRFFLPGTGLFLLAALLISQGMDILWRMAPETSWLLVVGVLGHAFISTSLISSSFAYYQGGMRWMQEAIRKAEPKKA